MPMLELQLLASNVVLDWVDTHSEIPSSNVCMSISGPMFGPDTLLESYAGYGSFNVVVQNGTLINNIAGY